jgi:hypothetical protein
VVPLLLVAALEHVKRRTLGREQNGTEFQLTLDRKVLDGRVFLPVVGNALVKSEINREHIQLISKCGIQYISENRNNKVKHYNYNKDYIIWSAEQSLKNLRTDYLDLFLLHRPSPLMHPGEIAKAINQLKAQGKIKDFGVSNFTPSQIELISSEVPVTINQVEFSLTQNKAMYDGTLDQAIIKNITPMSWSPLGCVFKEDTEQTRRIHKQLGELIDKYNATEETSSGKEELSLYILANRKKPDAPINIKMVIFIVFLLKIRFILYFLIVK